VLDGLLRQRHRQNMSVRSSPRYDASSQMGFHAKERREGGNPHQGVLRVREAAKRVDNGISLLCSNAVSGGADRWFPGQGKGQNRVATLR
jgi:hypothetical protein